MLLKRNRQKLSRIVRSASEFRLTGQESAVKRIAGRPASAMEKPIRLA
jgi:hypothetical protein